MKTVTTVPTVEHAAKVGAALQLRNLYSAMAGCKKDGYQVLVNPRDFEQAKKIVAQLEAA